MASPPFIAVPLRDFGWVWQYRVALLACTQVLAFVEFLDVALEIDLDVFAPEVDFVQHVSAILTEPRYAVFFAGFPWPFYYYAYASWRTPRGMKHIFGEQEDIAFVNAMLHLFPIFYRMHKDMSMQLIEDLVPRVDVEVIAGVRAFNDLKNEIGFLEHFAIANGTLRGWKMLFGPRIQIEWTWDFHMLLLLDK
jgi:hypothetical protein